MNVPFRPLCLSFFSLALAGSVWAEPENLDLSISSAHFSEWGGKKIAGEVVEQGENTGHVKVVFRPAENPQRKEIGILLTPELPEFSKVTMEVFTNVDTTVRIRLEDASNNPFIVKQQVVGGSWTPVTFELNAKSGKNWPPQSPYKHLAILALTPSGTEEQVFEVRNVQISKE
jgi:hypothetical protein